MNTTSGSHWRSRILLFLLCLIIQPFVPATAQESSTPRIRYDGWLISDPHAASQPMILIGTTDSSIRVLPYLRTVMLDQAMIETARQVPVTNIYSLEFRKRGAVEVGAAIGMLAGLALGFGMAAIETEMDNGSSNAAISRAANGVVDKGVAVVGTLMTTGLGLAVGIVIGSQRAKYRINGQKENFHQFEPAIRRRSL